jgi:gamma-glutamyltranspeptidase/glutathione hydrolase
VVNELSLETPLYELVGSQLAAMGHSVKSVSGEDVGGVQSIVYVPAPRIAHEDDRAEAPADERGKARADEKGNVHGVAGYYRAGSDFRKDGEAVGW